MVRSTWNVSSGGNVGATPGKHLIHANVLTHAAVLFCFQSRVLDSPARVSVDRLVAGSGLPRRRAGRGGRAPRGGKSRDTGWWAPKERDAQRRTTSHNVVRCVLCADLPRGAREDAPRGARRPQRTTWATEKEHREDTRKADQTHRPRNEDHRRPKGKPKELKGPVHPRGLLRCEHGPSSRRAGCGDAAAPAARRGQNTDGRAKETAIRIPAPALPSSYSTWAPQPAHSFTEKTCKTGRIRCGFNCGAWCFANVPHSLGRGRRLRLQRGQRGPVGTGFLGFGCRWCHVPLIPDRPSASRTRGATVLFTFWVLPSKYTFSYEK